MKITRRHLRKLIRESMYYNHNDLLSLTIEKLKRKLYNWHGLQPSNLNTGVWNPNTSMTAVSDELVTFSGPTLVNVFKDWLSSSMRNDIKRLVFKTGMESSQIKDIIVKSMLEYLAPFTEHRSEVRKHLPDRYEGDTIYTFSQKDLLQAQGVEVV